MYKALLITTGSPVIIAIYNQDYTLCQEFISEEKASEALIVLLSHILSEYPLDALFFVRGPGSSVGIKMGYLAARTLQITKNIPIFACDTFALKGVVTVRAGKNSAFIKEKDIISLRSGISEFSSLQAPTMLDPSLFHDEPLPLYVLPAV